MGEDDVLGFEEFQLKIESIDIYSGVKEEKNVMREDENIYFRVAQGCLYIVGITKRLNMKLDMSLSINSGWKSKSSRCLAWDAIWQSMYMSQ